MMATKKKGKLSKVVKGAKTVGKVVASPITIPLKGASIAYTASKNAYKKTEAFVHTDFWTQPNGANIGQQLVVFDLDTTTFSPRMLREMDKVLKQHGKILFKSTKGQDEAIKIIKDLQLSPLYEWENRKITTGDVCLACEGGKTILNSVNGRFDDATGIDLRAPQRDPQTGEKKTILADRVLMYPAAKPRKWLSESIGRLDAYAKSVPEAGITFNAADQEIKITGGTRQEQLAHLKNVMDSVMWLDMKFRRGPEGFDIPDARASDDYGVTFTEEGVVIRPIDRSLVNAELTVAHSFGIKPENVRRVVGSTAQINNNVPLNEMFSMLQKPDGSVYTTEEAQEAGVFEQMADRLINFDADMLYVDPQTNNGTYVARYRFGNRHSLNAFHDDYAKYQNRVNQEFVSQISRGNDEKSIRQALFDAMMPAYDVPALTKLPYITPYSKLLEAQEANDKETIEKFERQVIWQRNTTASVMQFLINVPADYNKTAKKGRISSFLYNITGKSTLPEPISANKEDFLFRQNDVLAQIRQYSNQLLAIQDAAERANESEEFSGFMLGIEQDIKSGLTQQEAFNKFEEYIKSRNLTQKLGDENSLQDTSTNENTLAPNDKPSDTNADNNNNNNNNSNNNTNENTQDQDDEYINQEILRQNIQANNTILRNIEDKYTKDGKLDVVAMSTDPAFVYFQNLNKTLDNKLHDRQVANGIIEHPSAAAAIDETQLQDGLYYSIVNNNIMIYNDRAQKEAVVSGVQPVLLDAFDLPEDMVNNPYYQQAQFQTLKGIKSVNLRQYWNPSVHKVFDASNKQMQASINETLLDTTTQDPKFDLIAEITKDKIESHNKSLEEVVTASVHQKDEKKEEENKQEQEEEQEKEDKKQDEKVQYKRDALFTKVCIKPSVDMYRRRRNFMTQTLANTQLTMQNNGLQNSAEYQILSEVASKWVAVVGAEDMTTIKKASDRDKELKQMNKLWEEIEQNYADNPAAVRRAQQLYTSCMMQSENMTLQYQKENPNSKVVKLSAQEKMDFVAKKSRLGAQNKQTEKILNGQAEVVFKVQGSANKFRETEAKKSRQQVARGSTYRDNQKRSNNAIEKQKDARLKAALAGKAKAEKILAEREAAKKAEEKSARTDKTAKEAAAKDAIKKAKKQKANKEKLAQTKPKSQIVKEKATIQKEKVQKQRFAPKTKQEEVGMQQVAMGRSVAHMEDARQHIVAEQGQNSYDAKKIMASERKVVVDLAKSMGQNGKCGQYVSNDDKKAIDKTVGTIGHRLFNAYAKNSDIKYRYPTEDISPEQMNSVVKIMGNKKDLTPVEKTIRESVQPFVDLAKDAQKKAKYKDKEQQEQIKLNDQRKQVKQQSQMQQGAADDIVNGKPKPKVVQPVPSNSSMHTTQMQDDLSDGVVLGNK